MDAIKTVAGFAKQCGLGIGEAEEGEESDHKPPVAILRVDVWVEAEVAEGLLVSAEQHRREVAGSVAERVEARREQDAEEAVGEEMRLGQMPAVVSVATS